MGANVVERQLSRRFQASLVGEGALVGLVAGAVVALYRFSLSNAERALRLLTSLASDKPLLVAAWFAVLAVLLLAVGRLIVWEPISSGSGIPQVDAEVIGRLDAPWHRVLAAKFAEGSLLAFAGLSMGREGPSVQLGGMSGKAVSRAFGRGRGEERLLVTCGAAAGMSAAFHAPLTGVLFALEEIHKAFTAPLIISVMCASVVADFIASQALGVRPVLSLALSADLAHPDYLLVLLLGLLTGLVGAAHNRGMFACQRLYGKIRSHLPYARLAVPFAVAGLAAFLWPELMCGGDAILERLVEPEGLALGTVVALLVGKYVFTTICFGSGAPGGTLFPLVVMGALFGAAFGLVSSQAGIVDAAYVPNFMVLGIAGLFSGAVRAPVTAVVLVFELTGSMDALLSASLVSIIAYVSANILRVDAFYEHLLAGLLKTTPEDPAVSGLAGEKSLVNVHVGTGSAAEGKLISEVAWPCGARVMMVERTGQSITPMGSTRLYALDELLVMVDESSAEEATNALNELCEPQAKPVSVGVEKSKG